MPTNLDDFNRVSASHQNLLSTLEKLFPNQDSGQNNLKCEITPTIDSIDYGVNEFHKSPRTQFSLVLCNGIVKNQVNPQSNQRFNGATEGNHWTTLHFRKDQNGKINDFYAD